MSDSRANANSERKSPVPSLYQETGVQTKGIVEISMLLPGDARIHDFSACGGSPVLFAKSQKVPCFVGLT